MCIRDRGNSIYPGNINCLVFHIPEYAVVLNETQGLIAEFINPKYEDATKTKFKSASRLECMMQDYPKLLKTGSKVGVTQIDRRFCFSACKNDIKSAAQKAQTGLPPESSSSCEYDFYWLNAEILRICGANVEQPRAEDERSYAGIKLNFGPKVVISPSFGVTLAEIRNKVKGLKVSGRSTFVVQGDASFENVTLDGSLVVSGNPETVRRVRNLSITGQNYVQLQEINPDDKTIEDSLRIRGYRSANTENATYIQG
eukprot:TRINITY_DN2581_c0_g1_i1.p2 TRINITY_DN2581_c0_g1~~TRINITY_DN2581_c0_g1_i1.p2  ORF type:complete len:291 (-),score=101.80 TRINITY_DN2581_c0_g1_i1:273-1040(-)